MSTSTIQVNVDAENSIIVENILNQLGMTQESAIQTFFKQIILQGGLPFDVKLPKPNALTAKTIDDARNGIGIEKFETLEGMFEELDKD